MKHTPATKPFATMIFLLVLIFGVVYTDGKTGNENKSCKEGPKGSTICPPPTPAPTVAPTAQPTLEDVQFTFENETIKFLNVANVSADDMESLFVIQKEWFETYFREQQDRRGLQDRRRDSRDITTDFEFVAQNVTNSTDDGKPTNEVTYNQVIGFGPNRRRLVEINIEDIDEVYQVSTSIYRDMEALDNLATELRENVTSFSNLESIVKFAPPTLSCGFLCQEIP